METPRRTYSVIGMGVTKNLDIRHREESPFSGPGNIDREHPNSFRTGIYDKAIWKPMIEALWSINKDLDRKTRDGSTIIDIGTVQQAEKNFNEFWGVHKTGQAHTPKKFHMGVTMNEVTFTDTDQGHQDNTAWSFLIEIHSEADETFTQYDCWRSTVTRTH